jgi:hypothetical protein
MGGDDNGGMGGRGVSQPHDSYGAWERFVS